MQLLFRLLELPEFIQLAIELSLKSARFLAMPRHGRYDKKLNFSPVRGSILMRFRSLESSEFILLAIELSLLSVAKCIFCDILKY